MIDKILLFNYIKRRPLNCVELLSDNIVNVLDLL